MDVYFPFAHLKKIIKEIKEFESGAFLSCMYGTQCSRPTNAPDQGSRQVGTKGSVVPSEAKAVEGPRNESPP